MRTEVIDSGGMIEFYPADDSYNVTGCCGNCYVLADIKFCPFCGAALKKA